MNIYTYFIHVILDDGYTTILFKNDDYFIQEHAIQVMFKLEQKTV